MSRLTRRELERRVEDAEAADEDYSEWMSEYLPRELWGRPKEIWKYDLTEGESHPHLPSPDELADRNSGPE